MGKLPIKDRARASHVHHPARGMPDTPCGQPLKCMGPGTTPLRISKIALCVQICALNEWMKITLGKVRTPYKRPAKNLGTVPGACRTGGGMRHHRIAGVSHGD